MKMMKTLLATAVVASAAVATPVMAYEAGDIFVKAGVITVQTTNDAADISASGVSTSNNTQFGITGTYMFHSKWGVELLAATPFKHNVYLSDDVGQFPSGAKAATTKHLPPTVSLQFYPLSGSDSIVQPYLGVGVNYTTFFSDKEVDAVGGEKLKLKDSWGLAYSAGVNVHLTENWLANVAVWKMDINTKVKNGALAGSAVTLDPTVFLVGVGYKF